MRKSKIQVEHEISIDNDKCDNCTGMDEYGFCWNFQTWITKYFRCPACIEATNQKIDILQVAVKAFEDCATIDLITQVTEKVNRQATDKEVIDVLRNIKSTKEKE